jgi:purine-nucleoside phosphorylase
MDILKDLEKAADYIKGRSRYTPEIGLILGSGLGVLGDEIIDPDVFEYSDIPGFPVSTVEGHAGRLIMGKLQGRSVIVLQGRFHYYEGYDFDRVVFPVRVMKLLGVENLMVTNAAGGINRDFRPGDLMLIDDHIKFFIDSPLRGPNLSGFGPRFNDMSYAYDSRLKETALSAAAGLGVPLQRGVYAFMGGPSFETPAEIRMLSVLGADAVGMSTVPEVITAVHGGMRVLGLSCISNMAAGILDQPLNHQEVMETGEKVRTTFLALVKAILGQWPL